MYRFYLVNFLLQFIEREQLNWFYRADFRIKLCHDLKLRYAQTFWEKTIFFNSVKIIILKITLWMQREPLN